MKNIHIPNWVRTVRFLQNDGLSSEQIRDALNQDDDVSATPEQVKTAMLLELKRPAPIPGQSQFLRMLQEAWDLVNYSDNPFEKEKAIKLIERWKDYIAFS
jgi:hypothetical protein